MLSYIWGPLCYVASMIAKKSGEKYVDDHKKMLSEEFTKIIEKNLKEIHVKEHNVNMGDWISTIKQIEENNVPINCHAYVINNSKQVIRFCKDKHIIIVQSLDNFLDGNREYYLHNHREDVRMIDTRVEHVRNLPRNYYGEYCPENNNCEHFVRQLLFNQKASLHTSMIHSSIEEGNIEQKAIELYNNQENAPNTKFVLKND
jgi:hypothetical protein